MNNNFQIRPLVEAALREDIRSGDITTNALIPVDARATAQMRMRENGVLSGIELAKMAFSLLDENVRFSQAREDGETLQSGDVILEIEGRARAVLTAERVSLNFVQRLSGIATLTAQFVAQTQGTKARIADTRKTTPTIRVLEKYAVRCGGGSNHRFALACKRHREIFCSCVADVTEFLLCCERMEQQFAPQRTYIISKNSRQ